MHYLHYFSIIPGPLHKLSQVRPIRSVAENAKMSGAKILIQDKRQV
jgi:hypothetical protein